MERLNLALTLQKRLLLFICIAIATLPIISVISALVLGKFGITTPAVRIVTIFQDLMFMLPPIVTAVMVTRRPATLLGIDRGPDLRMLALAIAALFLSIPAMDFIIYLNQNVPLPKAIADPFSSLEDNATSMIKAMYGAHDLPNLILTILIVGVMAGLSEELLFRGGLQRLLVTGGVNVHAAIWITAAVFSLIHLQFYGFVPRMLLGAFFGYLLVWTRSLWVPVILHVTNNTVYLITEWMGYSQDTLSSPSDTGDHHYLMIGASAVVTVVLLYIIARLSTKENEVKEVQDK